MSRGDGVGEGRPLAHEFVDGVDRVKQARPETLVVPGVLADGDGERLAVEQSEGLARGGFEITLLVEDVVEREQHFLLDKRDFAPGEQRGDIAGVLADGGMAIGGDGWQGNTAEDGRAGGGGGGNLIERFLRAGEEGGLFEEVGWRVAADGEFREDDEVGG